MERKVLRTYGRDNFKVKNNPNIVSYKTFFDKNLDYWIDYIMPYVPVKYSKDYKDKREAAQRYLWHISAMFFDLVAKDMIYNNTQFVFADKGLRIMIGDRMRWSKKYKYKLHKGGHNYIPFCYVGKALIKRRMKYYYIYLSDRYKRMLCKAIKDGEEYELIPNFDY